MANVPSLEDFLCGHSLPDVEIPSRRQRRQWLYRLRRELPTTGDNAAFPSVNSGDHFANKWSLPPQTPISSSADLYVLGSKHTDEQVVYVPHACNCLFRLAACWCNVLRC